MGLPLWDALWAAGQPFHVLPGSPNLIERVEGGLLSLGNEMTRDNNPLECGMAKYCTLDGSIDFIGKEALLKIAAAGPKRMIRGVLFGGDRCPPAAHPWPVMVNEETVGHVTTCIWSPRFEQNVALGMIDRGYWEPDRPVLVVSPDGQKRPGRIVTLPFSA